MNANSRIRVAGVADAAALPSVQISAGALFRTVPELAWIADEPVEPSGDYLPMIARGHVWVAETLDGTIAGCIFGEIMGNDFHILELAVAEHVQRRGIGRRLLDAVRAHAEASGLSALTLTTFRHVAWNAPFYARCGFRELIAPGEPLKSILASEVSRGLPDRCAMALAL